MAGAASTMECALPHGPQDCASSIKDTGMAHLRDVLKDHIVDDRSGWSMGSLGAVAEFHRDRGEYLEADAPTMFVRATPRDAIRLNAGTVGRSSLSPMRPSARSRIDGATAWHFACRRKIRSWRDAGS
ncbi:DUF6925 family protein [Shinella sp. WSC3-e]|uniref:DUF6925 family protein n=2 Tax=Shinella TaxID=323620 RepID=UPI00225C837B|nr:hypothetical protein SHINE37_110217 [Rhizobiaceae bacterium]